MSNLVYKETQAVTPVQKEVYTVSKTVVVDSRQRDCSKYKTPSFYKLNLGDVFKNINSIELKGAIIPKSSYNVHSSNNKIDFAIGDFVSSFNIIDGGGGYISAPNVTISAPPGPGVTATATAIINSAGRITNIIIGVAGSGYIPSKPPFVFIDYPTNSGQAVQPKVVANVGNFYTATLRIGDYDIGGNVNPPTTTVPSGLLLEIQNAMNYAVNGGAYNPNSTSPFSVAVVSQYPDLNAVAGTPESFNTNACKYNRIQVVNVNSNVWQFLWCSGPSRIETSAGILGFNTVDSGIGVAIPAIVGPGGTIISAGTAIRGSFDYNLNNDPDYVILTIGTGDRNLDRITSLDDGIDHRFCTLLFDNNNPETLHDLSGASVNVGGTDYLTGPTGKGIFWRSPSGAKPIKGYDFDVKKISFKPPLAKISSMTIAFTKFGYRPGTSPQFYNMEGREHVLLFELSATDQMSQQRE